MQVSEALRARRAIKWYDPEHKMPEETFKKLMEHAILSPTAFNIQNWRFVRINDKEQRKAIRAAAWDQAQLCKKSCAGSFPLWKKVSWLSNSPCYPNFPKA